ncbi:MAG: large ribosomal subunit protein uL22, partial [bacterium]
MEARATARYQRISPLKVRRTLTGLRGMAVGEAAARLRMAPSVVSKAVAKVLKSAVANAENNYDLDADDLIVARVYV